jgi:hypothetical protein
MRGPHNLIFYPKELQVHAYAHTCACVRGRTCVCVRAHMCVCIHIRVCVHCVCARVCTQLCTYVRACVVYLCVRMCVHAYVCACGCVCVRVYVCACEWIEDTLPLGVLPKERVSLPRCLSTLGALRGGLGGYSGLSQFSGLNSYPNASFVRPLSLGYINASDTPRGVRNVRGTR